MYELLMLAALAIVPQDSVLRETCDLTEVNHFYDEHGRLVFDQIIFMDWSAKDSRYQVRAWRLVKKPEQVPHADHENGGYVAMWDDGEQCRKVHSLAIRESWTQYDPELNEREYLPKEKRKELRRVKEKPQLVRLPVAS